MSAVSGRTKCRLTGWVGDRRTYPGCSAARRGQGRPVPQVAIGSARCGIGHHRGLDQRAVEKCSTAGSFSSARLRGVGKAVMLDIARGTGLGFDYRGRLRRRLQMAGGFTGALIASRSVDHRKEGAGLSSSTLRGGRAVLHRDGRAYPRQRGDVADAGAAGGRFSRRPDARSGCRGTRRTVRWVTTRRVSGKRHHRTRTGYNRAATKGVPGQPNRQPDLRRATHREGGGCGTWLRLVSFLAVRAFPIWYQTRRPTGRCGGITCYWTRWPTALCPGPGPPDAVGPALARAARGRIAVPSCQRWHRAARLRRAGAAVRLSRPSRVGPRARPDCRRPWTDAGWPPGCRTRRSRNYYTRTRRPRPSLPWS